MNEEDLLREFLSFNEENPGGRTLSDLSRFMLYRFPELELTGEESNKICFKGGFLEVEVEIWGKSFLLTYEIKISDELKKEEIVRRFFHSLFLRVYPLCDLKNNSAVDVLSTVNIESGIMSALRKWFDAVRDITAIYYSRLGIKTLNGILMHLTNSSEKPDSCIGSDFDNAYPDAEGALFYKARVISLFLTVDYYRGIFIDSGF